MGFKDRTAAWKRCREGNVAMLFAFAAFPLILVTGGAVEFGAQEMLRSRAQQALDRGVLAAAALNQTEDAKTVIKGYLDHGLGAGQYDLPDPEVERSLNRSHVKASVTLDYRTSFLRLAGIDNFSVHATSSAEESRPNIEISLILDVSGSMIDNGGLAQLKPAARRFIDTILTEDMRSVTSVNLIPFAGGVNVGSDAFDFLIGGSNRRTHKYSSCFEFENTDYAATIPNFRQRRQMPHFTIYNYEAQPKQPWWCPTDETAITLLSNRPEELKQRISDLRAFDGTGTQYAVKWANILLDPAMRGGVSAAASVGLVPREFASRPADYESETTRKFIIVMTDGQISSQPRPPKERQHRDYEPHRVTRGYGAPVTSGQATEQYHRVCQAAKNNGVVVFTLAFKINQENIARSLAQCATSEGHAYRADGLDIEDAFQSIASAIKRLRLVG